MDGDIAPEVQPAFPGTLVAVVGPSGAGKDTVMRLASEELRDIPGIIFATRVITRPPHASETYEAIDEEGFAAREAAGDFLISWRANGLAYGLPAILAQALARGSAVVANFSRGAVASARKKAIRVLAVEITAEHRLLAERIAVRGREDAVMREDRLARNAAYAETFHADIVIANNGTPDLAASRLAEIIRIYAPQGSSRL